MNKYDLYKNVSLNTTVVRNSYLKEKFYQMYDVFFIKKDNGESYKNFYKKIINDENIQSYIATKNNGKIGAILLTKKNTKIKTDNLIKSLKYNELSKDDELNLFLKLIPKINPKSQFTVAERLMLQLEYKRSNKIKVGEYTAIELFVNNGVLEVLGATFSDSEDLSVYFSKFNNKRLNKLRESVKYSLSKSFKIIKDKNEKENGEVVKMRFSKNVKNTFLVHDYRHEYRDNTKLNIIYLFIKEIEKFNDLIHFEFEKEDYQLLFSDKNKLNERGDSFVFEEEYENFFKQVKVGIVFTEKDNEKNKEIYEELSMLVKKRIDIIKLNKMDKYDMVIVVLNNIETYEKNNEIDVYKTFNKEKTQSLTYEIYNGAEFVKRAILNKVINELIMKYNIKMEFLNFFSINYNCSLIKILNDGVSQYFYGVMVKDGKMKFSEDLNEILNEKFINKIQNVINADVKEISISSYGKKNEDGFLFENVFIDEIINKRILLNFNEYDKFVNNSKNMTRESNINNYQSHYALGLVGNYFKKETEKEFLFLPGYVSPKLQGNLGKFPKLHKGIIVNGKVSRDVFNLFNHYYINTNDSTKRPFLNKYLNEKFRL